MIDVHIILAAPKQEKIKPLLQSEGFIIGVDGGAEIALEESIELDLALGDFDSITYNNSLEIKKNSKSLFTFPSEKDDTDAELALLYILENIEAKNIYVYNWYGGRLDHLQSILMLVLQKRFNSLVSKLHFISEKNKISYYIPGEYELIKEEGMNYLSLVLLTEVEGITLNQVKYPLKNKDYYSPRALISNKFLDKKAFLSFKTGILSVIQSSD